MPPITIPVKGTFYDAGTIQAVHGDSIIIAGRIINFASGDIGVAANR